MAKLSEAAERVLASIIRLSERAHGRSPTFPEVAEDIERSISSVQLQVRNLTAWGYLIQMPGPRGLHVLKNPDGSARGSADLLTLPILGTVAAGEPIEIVDGDPDTLTVPLAWCQGACYVLRVRGESMTEDGIHDGDLILVQATPAMLDATSIYVCMIPGVGASIKRVDTSAEGKALLKSSNRAFKPIVAPYGTIVQGRVIRVIREFESDGA